MAKRLQLQLNRRGVGNTVGVQGNMTLTDKERYVLKAILDNVLLDKDYFLTNGIPRGVRTDTEAFGAVNRLYKLMRPIKK
jgi:hypothetical protein